MRVWIVFVFGVLGGGGGWVEDDTNDSWMSVNWNSTFTYRFIVVLSAGA